MGQPEVCHFWGHLGPWHKKSCHVISGSDAIPHVLSDVEPLGCGDSRNLGQGEQGWCREVNAETGRGHNVYLFPHITLVTMANTQELGPPCHPSDDCSGGWFAFFLLVSYDTRH